MEYLPIGTKLIAKSVCKMKDGSSFFVYRDEGKYSFYQELDRCSVSNRSIIKIGNKFENAELLLAVV